MLEAPETRYARSGRAQIAYQVVGDGPRDLVYATSFLSNVEVLWENPAAARFLRSLASFSRLILFDKRGVGMSDAWDGLVTAEHRVDDIEAVLDAAGSETAVTFGSSEGAATCAMFAATHPGRTAGLILFSPAMLAPPDENAPWAWSNEQYDAFEAGVDEAWGTGAGLEIVNPSLGDDPEMRRWYARYWRLSASPDRLKALMHVNRQIDIRPLVPAISVPTLIMHRVDEIWIDVGSSRYLASHIPGARLVELPGADHEPWVGDTETILGEIREFVTGVREGPAPDRVLATVLFTDIVDSTASASAAGDRRWRALLDRHDDISGREITRHGGRQIKSTGDGVLATFDGPTRAIRCGIAVRDALRGAGIDVRAGLHTGEIELRGDDIGGIAVHIGQRVSAQAQGGEVLASRTVKDLVAGSGIEFDDRGTHELKGVPDTWQLFAVRD